MKLESNLEERSKQEQMALGNKTISGGAGCRRSSIKTRCMRSLLTFLSALTISFWATTLLAQTIAKEYRIKAAFLFNFAQYVEWPPDTFKDANSPLTYCTIGDDPFQGMLDESLNAKSVGTHPLRVQHLKQAENFQGCQILFIGANEKKRITAVLETLKQSPLPVVGEANPLLQQGGPPWVLFQKKPHPVSVQFIFAPPPPPTIQ